MNEGPSAGLRWVYFVSPWGMTMELVSTKKRVSTSSINDQLMLSLDT